MTRVKIWHASMQFSDSDAQHTKDVNKVFGAAREQGVAWITGTEAGPGSGNLNELLSAIAPLTGYHLYHPLKTDNWLAVSTAFIDGGFTGRYHEVFPGKAHLHSSRGIVSATFRHDKLGTITVGTSHLLTKGQQPGDPFFAQNTRYTKAIGDWAREYGAGSRLLFFGGDMNEQDARVDTFRGQPLTSCWDELKIHPSTGHGEIDLVANYDLDTRVRCHSARSFDDRAFFLNSDHFLIEAVYDIREL
jgi:hypothetical protein